MRVKFEGFGDDSRIAEKNYKHDGSKRVMDAREHRTKAVTLPVGSQAVEMTIRTCACPSQVDTSAGWISWWVACFVDCALLGYSNGSGGGIERGFGVDGAEVDAW